MSDWKTLFHKDQFRFIDHTNSIETVTALDAFAVDDALALSVEKGASPTTMRIWTHDQTVVLGIPDARLPFIKEGVSWLNQQGYQAVVRNSGGLAVVLDKGVMNITLLFADGNKIGIHEGYQMMVGFIQELFADYTDQIKAFEVKGSYCPGDYDLSIDGKKFAGISQRRVKNGVAVQIYLSIEADDQARAKLIESFYKLGLQGEKSKFAYPTVEPNTMEALATLLDKPLTIDFVKNRIREKLTDLTKELQQNDLTAIEKEMYQKRKQQMIVRNKKALGDLFHE